MSLILSYQIKFRQVDVIQILFDGRSCVPLLSNFFGNPVNIDFLVLISVGSSSSRDSGFLGCFANATGKFERVGV